MGHDVQAEVAWSVGNFKFGDEEIIASDDWIGGKWSWWLRHFRESASALGRGRVVHDGQDELAWRQAQLDWSVGIFECNNKERFTSNDWISD